MDTQQLSQIREGLEARTPVGTHVGKVVAVKADEPGGYIDIEDQRQDRVRRIRVPLTEVLDVRADSVVVEVDPDIVAAHDMQWFPENPVKDGKD